MKIHLERNGTVFEYELQPMKESRFRVLCYLAGAAIGGVVLLGAIHMIGVWAIVWAVGALALTGLYKLLKEGF